MTANTAYDPRCLSNERMALETQITGQPAFPVFASAKDKFFLKVVDARLDFERDAGRKIVAYG